MPKPVGRVLSSCLAVLAIVLVAGMPSHAWAGPSGDWASAGSQGGRSVSRAPSTHGRLKGIDVSHWNGKVGWAKVKATGVQFAIAKASQGTGYTDPSYAAYAENARQVGIRIGAYEFADPDPGSADPVKDADHFLKVAAPHPRDLIPVLDLEQTGGLHRQALLTWVTRWCHRVRSQLGVWPAIYTSPSFWQTHMTDTRAFARRGDPLWIAHWFVSKPTVPAGNWSGHGWRLWQWSDRGRLNGISGRTDLDLLNGTSLRSLSIKHARNAHK